MISTILLFGLLGFRHKHKPAPQLPEVFVQLNNQDELSRDIAELDAALTTCPWLESLATPNIELALKLLTESGQEPDYQSDLLKLSTDVWLVESMEQNDTI